MLRLPFDLGRAVVALALASGLWVFVQNEQNPDRTDIPNFTVPVEIVNTPPGMIVVSEAPRVQVRVRAPSEFWPLLRPASFHAIADGSTARPGVNEFTVSVEVLESRVRSVDSIPPRVNAVLEDVVERVVPVRVNINGNVPFGYAYSTPRLSQESVTVTGPSSGVLRVEAVVVDVRLDGLTVGLDATYAPRAVDARGLEVRDVRITPPTVNVEVPVAQQVGYKEVGVRPQVRGRVAPGYYLQPVEVEPATVTVVGSPAVLGNVDFVDTEPIDVGGISSSVVRRVQVVPSTGLTLLQPQPVNVTLRVTPLTVAQTVRLYPTLLNLGPNLNLSSSLPQLDVTLVGPAPTLQSLTPTDFRVVLDLAGLREGRHELEPRVTIPPGFTLERLDPPRVVVMLRAVPTPTPIPAPTPEPPPPEPPPPEPTPTPVP